MQRQKILLFLANPIGTSRISIESEAKEMEEKLYSSNHRELFEVKPILAATADNFLENIQRHTPTIIHFSGHGSETGKMVTEDKENKIFLLKASQFVNMLTAKPVKDKLKLVVLNACYMQTYAEIVSKEVPCVIGTNNAIPDITAKEFSKVFYFSLANGFSAKEAFDAAMNSADIHSLPGLAIPILLGDGKIRFVEKEDLSSKKATDTVNSAPVFNIGNINQTGSNSIGVNTGTVNNNLKE